MSTKKAFKAESKRLLEMMINSIYTHKEIFIRELISNASDAMDKLYFKSLNENLGLDRGDFQVRLTPDKDARTLTITDNGIGMTQEELENNLGVIAQSGSLKFKEAMKTEENAPNSEEVSVIGQFGVGFYSAFMVAGKVTVKSKAYGAENAYLWSSEGVDGYTVEECEKDGHGTEITLYLKEDTEDEDYGEFLAEYKLRSLVKKYSDYIRYPIKMEVTHRHPKEDAPEDAPESEKYEEHTEDETLNSMIPIWKKIKASLRTRITITSIRKNSTITQNLSLIYTARPRATPPIPRFCLSPKRRHTTIIQRNLKRGSSFIPTAYLLWTSAATCYPIISAL